jgi:hypothetical protein
MYVGLLLSVITWGVPSIDRVFLYHMDEWHQLMAIRSLASNLTTTTEGAAHGAVFHFLVSGAFLGIFQVLHVINIFDISNSVAGLDTQQKVFIILRLSTLLYGVGTIMCMYRLVRYELKIASYWVGLAFFTATPIWISLSNYFKYDIALTFWITLSLVLLLRFIDNPSWKNYLLAGVSVGLAFGTKISAIPIMFLYGISYFYGVKHWKSDWKLLINGIAVMLLTTFLLGVPDLLIGTGNYSIILNDVVIDYPANSYNYNLGSHFWLYLLFNQVPVNFGRPLALAFLISFTYVTFQLFQKIMASNNSIFSRLLLLHDSNETKKVCIIFIGFILFATSLYPLKLFSSGNRMLVLLPFIALLTSYVTNQIISHSKYKRRIFMVLLVAISFQIVESLSWVAIKWQQDPRETSSVWVKQHIPAGTVIGVTQPFIYQYPPDVLLKDYYFDLEDTFDYSGTYSYVDVLSSQLEPNVIVLTNLEHEKHKFKSPTYQLYSKLLDNGYETVATFSPNYGVQKYFNDPLSFAVPNLIPTPLDITILANQEGKSRLQ